MVTCRVVVFLQTASTFISAWTLMAMSIER